MGFAGRKRVPATSLTQLELGGDLAPQVGDYAIATDWQGKARPGIRTDLLGTHYLVIRFQLVQAKNSAVQ